MPGGVEEAMWRRKEQGEVVQGVPLETVVVLSPIVFLLVPHALSSRKTRAPGGGVWHGFGC